MKTSTFDFEEKRLKTEITKRKAKRVLIQLPEGLKPYGQRLAEIAEKTGALAIVSADPCYGACDLAITDAQTLKADLIIHYGHTKMIEQKRVPTIYIEAKAKAKVKSTIKKALPLLKQHIRVGLVATVQHVHKLDETREVLLKAGKTVVVGDARRLQYAGQVIGCNFSNAKAVKDEVEAYLFLGGGKFHALGVALATMKPTVIADPYEKRAYTIENEVKQVLRQRWAAITEAKTAKTFGVLIGLKTGQQKLVEAIRIKEKLEKHGKKATLLALREITPEALMQFPTIDTFINTACPRLAIDNSKRFLKPILLINETQVMLGELSWEKLCKEGLFGN